MIPNFWVSVADYPQVPPSVHFMTTGGGGVRFNPNLYNSGKICLSLLGTWNGPGWIPGRSTLLQVLVSIQSLIFVQNPYYNEPGYEQNMHCSEAENENMHHREHTLALAILAPLRRPDAMFADVISEHFQHKREEVEQQCQQWCAYASDINTKNRMANLMKDIKAQLQILCCSAWIFASISSGYYYFISALVFLLVKVQCTLNNMCS